MYNAHIYVYNNLNEILLLGGDSATPRNHRIINEQNLRPRPGKPSVESWSKESKRLPKQCRLSLFLMVASTT